MIAELIRGDVDTALGTGLSRRGMAVVLDGGLIVFWSCDLDGNPGAHA